MTGDVASAGLPRRLPVALVRASWFFVVPCVAAALGTHFLFPTFADADASGLVRFLVYLSRDFTIPIFAGLFLLVALLVRYWRSYLPGAAFLETERAPSQAAGWQLATLTGGMVLAALVALFVRGSVIETFRVAGGSMLPSLDFGDELLVEKSAYGLHVGALRTTLATSTPRRGDIVVFHANAARFRGGEPDLVKRVIGLPGDEIEVNQGRPVINGWAVPICDAGVFAYLGEGAPMIGRVVVEWLGDKSYLTVQDRTGIKFAKHHVGPNELFVLGDNRDLSIDSRVAGDVPESLVAGRVRRILFGTTRDGHVEGKRIFKTTSHASVPHLPGLDVAPLRAAIDKCLAAPPKITTPPSG